MRTMITRTLIGLVVISGLRASPLAAVEAPPAIFVKADAATSVRLSEAYAKPPLYFEANRGQTDQQVKFLSRGRGHVLLLTPTETVLVLSSAERPARGKLPSALGVRDRREDAPGAVLRTTFVGASPEPRVVGRDELDGKVNYFIGNDPAQ